MPPAMAPARPARRTIEASTPPPANPRISDTFDTSPSLIPNTAARAEPPVTERCWWWTSPGPWPNGTVRRPGRQLGHRYAPARRPPGRRRRTTATLAVVDAATPSPRPSAGCATSPPCASPTTRCSCGSCRSYYSELPADDVDDRKLDDIYAVAVAHLALGRVRAPRRLRGRGCCRPTAIATAGSPSTRCCSSSPTTCRSSSTRCGWCSSGAACASTCSCTRCCGPFRDERRPTRRRRPRLGRRRPGALEAWTQIEIDRTDESTAAAVEADILRAVDDVQRVVDDFDAMRGRMEALAGDRSDPAVAGRRPVRLPRAPPTTTSPPTGR